MDLKKVLKEKLVIRLFGYSAAFTLKKMDSQREKKYFSRTERIVIYSKEIVSQV